MTNGLPSISHARKQQANNEKDIKIKCIQFGLKLMKEKK